MTMPPHRVYRVECTHGSLHQRLQTTVVANLVYERYEEDEALASFDFNCYYGLDERGSDNPGYHDIYKEDLYLPLSHFSSTPGRWGSLLTCGICPIGTEMVSLAGFFGT